MILISLCHIVHSCSVVFHSGELYTVGPFNKRVLIIQRARCLLMRRLRSVVGMICHGLVKGRILLSSSGFPMYFALLVESDLAIGIVLLLLHLLLCGMGQMRVHLLISVL